MKKILISGLVGMVLLGGCNKKQDNTAPQKTTQQIQIEESVITESYSIVPKRDFYDNEGKKQYNLLGNGREFYKVREDDGSLKEGIVGTWCGREGEIEPNPDYDEIFYELVLNEDKSLILNKTKAKFVEEAGEDGFSIIEYFKEVDKFPQATGSWELKGNSLEIKIKK